MVVLPVHPMIRVRKPYLQQGRLVSHCCAELVLSRCHAEAMEWRLGLLRCSTDAANRRFSCNEH